MVNKLPWISLLLLLAAYSSLGWVVSGPEFPEFSWLPFVCEQVVDRLLAIATQTPQNVCRLAVEHNLLGGLLAVGWILLASFAFMSPLSSFSRFVNRWFQSDTVAFLSIFMLAGLATLVLFWLHVFLQILTVLAAEALVRIEMQTIGLTAIQAFWMLASVSLIGLLAGWITHAAIF